MNNNLSILEIKEYIENETQEKLSIEKIIEFLETAINIKSDFQINYQETDEISSKEIFDQFISHISKEEILSIYNYINNDKPEENISPQKKHKTLTKKHNIKI